MSNTGFKTDSEASLEPVPPSPAPGAKQSVPHSGSEFRIPGLGYSTDNERMPVLKENAYSCGKTDSEGMLVSLSLDVPKTDVSYNAAQAQVQTANVDPVNSSVAATEASGLNDIDMLSSLEEIFVPSMTASELKPGTKVSFTAIDEVDNTKMASEQLAPQNNSEESSLKDKSLSIYQVEHQKQDKLGLKTDDGELKATPELAPAPRAQIAMKDVGIESALRALKGLDDKKITSDQMVPAAEAEPENSEIAGRSSPLKERTMDPLDGVETDDRTANPSIPELNEDDTVRSEGTTMQEDRTATGPPLSDSTYVPPSVTSPLQANPELPHSPAPEAEFAYDSSPYTSSTETSDTSSSEDDSDESADDYELLNPVEQARLLMAEDGGGSDGEGGGNGKAAGPPKTLNEKSEVIVPKPDIVVTPEMQITLLGHVENIVENLSLVKATVSGEYQVLEAGSLLCLEDRTVVGVIAETLGRVQQPYYSVAFTNAVDMAEVGMSKPETKVFYVPQFANTVFTQVIKSIKGSDASNLHDEEVDDDEMEFSDDEKEAEYKRSIKQEKEARKRERNGLPAAPPRDSIFHGRDRKGNGKKRHIEQGDPGQQWRSSYDANQKGADTELKYEDDDELYTPLTRPSSLHEAGQAQPPVHSYPPAGYSRPPRGGRGGRGRGRGGRDGQFRGGRRGGGHSLPPRPPISNDEGYNNHNPPNFPQQPNIPQPHYQQQPQNSNFSIQGSMPRPPPPPPPQNFPLPGSQYQVHNNQYPQPSPQTYQNNFGGYQDQTQQPQPGYHHQPYSMQNQYQPLTQPQFPSYQQQEQQRQQQQRGGQPLPGLPNVPPGAFINPAFFRPSG